MLNFAIAQESFWRDEAFSMLLAVKSPFDILITVAKDQSPPLYFLILHYWIQFGGTSEAYVRLFSLIFHGLSCVVLFFLAGTVIKSWWGRALTFIAFALNPFLIQYAYEARPYSFLTFLTMLSVLLLIKRKYILTGIVLSLSILTHNFAIFNLCTIGIWWVLNNRRDFMTHFWEGVKIFLLPFLTLLAWGSVVIQQVQRVSGAFWITEKTPAMFNQLFQSFTRGDIWHQNSDILFFFSLVVIIAGLSPLFTKKEKITSIVMLYLSLAIIPVVITYIVSLIHAPIFYQRYLIASLPFFLLVVGWGLAQLWSEHIWTKIFVICSLGLYVFNLKVSAEQIVNNTTKPAINWGVAQALSQAKPGDILVSENSINFLETKWYAYHNSKGIKAYTVARHGVPYYIGTSVFDQGDILRVYPQNKNIWIIQEDGGFYKLIRPYPSVKGIHTRR